MTSGQQDLLARLQGIAPELQARWDDPRGVVGLARNLPAVSGTGEVRHFLAAYGALYGPSDLARRLRLLHTRTDRLGWRHAEYQQEYELRTGGRTMRVPVFGSRLVLHLTPAGALAEVWSNCWRDVTVAAPPRLTAARVRRQLADALNAVRPPDRRSPERADRGLALEGPPRLVIYPWRGAFRLAWTMYGRAAVQAAGVGSAVSIEVGDVFVDAVTGEMFLFFPTRTHVAGSGFGVTPIGGPYTLRALEVRQVAGQTHELVDTTRARHIKTYHDACVSRPGDLTSRCNQLIAAVVSGTRTPSRNTTGPDWLTAAATSATLDREASQQPEVDGHFFAGQVYDWYAAVGGREGWDDNAFPAGVVEPSQPIRVVVHTRDPLAGACQTPYSQFWRANVNGFWCALVLFCDGNLIATSPNKPRNVDYPVGSRAIFAHEYQHVVTYFSFRNDQNEPGIGYEGWAAALHEGLSDAFGCMFAGQWILGTDIGHDLPPGPIRNLAYPRDPTSWENRPGGFAHANKDHFDDRTPPPSPTFGTPFPYDQGTILAHCAFLMAAGGVHQREGQPPRAPLIPVHALDGDLVGGAWISRAARIWYEALASFSATLGQVTSSEIDENLFRGFRDACESVAILNYGVGSREHRTTLLAFHAVGLDAPGVPYGADLTFLRWGAEWVWSRPYLGGIRSTCPNWSSIDLFVNNGGTAGWNAVVDALGPTGQPLAFENSVYARVRNVGDQKATNITVDFFYAKVGSAGTGWQPVTDFAGNVQRLVMAELDAGALSFPESDQDTPPANVGVKWYIPPLAPGESVDHFCLKAVVASPDDVNPHNNEVQSNVVYTRLAAGGVRPFRLPFVIANPRDVAIDVEIALTVPEGWRGALAGAPERLRPGQERTVTLAIEAPADADAMTPPLDGEVRGHVRGPAAGRCVGALTEVRERDGRILGRVALEVETVGVLLGTFDGTLDRKSGAMRGRVSGVFHGAGGADRALTVAFDGGLRPWRRVEITQTAGHDTLGGITVEFRRPPPEVGDWPPDPPTATRADRL